MRRTRTIAIMAAVFVAGGLLMPPALQAGDTPSSIRNIVIDQQGAAWTVAFEWSNDGQQTWTLFETRFPRDFDDLSVADGETERVMLDLALAVFGGEAQSLQNIDIQDFGNRWDVGFEYSNDGQQTWQSFTAQFPRDFAVLTADNVEPVMLDLAIAVFQARDIIPIG